jgi:putative hydrolase of the HAD superfamily
MPIRFLLFDLDETLYPRDAGVMQQIGRQIRQYIVREYGTTWDEADALARRYHNEYGTSMRGLLVNQGLDVERYLAYVHDFPLDGLQPNHQLDALLAGLPAVKVIFTNADRPHAERVLAQLGIRRHFSRIIDVVAVGYIPKPHLEAYTNCLRLLDAHPAECVLIEDTGRNLAPAKQLGMTTVLVDGNPNDPADYKIPTILELGPVVEAIFGRQGDRVTG